jgi:hypothetical protein
MENFLLTLKVLMLTIPVIIVCFGVFALPYLRNFNSIYAELKYNEDQSKALDRKWLQITLLTLAFAVELLSVLKYFWGIGVSLVPIGLLLAAIILGGFYFHSCEYLKKELYVERKDYLETNRVWLATFLATIATLIGTIVIKLF